MTLSRNTDCKPPKAILFQTAQSKRQNISYFLVLVFKDIHRLPQLRLLENLIYLRDA